MIRMVGSRWCGSRLMRDPRPQATLAVTIRALREGMGWTQVQLAEACCVGARTVYGWEAGTQDPRGRDLARLAEVTGARLSVSAGGWRHHQPRAGAIRVAQ